MYTYNSERGHFQVTKLFNGKYAMEINVPLHTQVISEKTRYTLIGWDSSIFVSLLLIQILY